jgi:hypothetical protein
MNCYFQGNVEKKMTFSKKNFRSTAMSGTEEQTRLKIKWPRRPLWPATRVF